VTHGQNDHLHLTIHDDTELARPGAELAPEAAPSDPADDVTQEAWQELQQRLSWQYPFPVPTRTPAKTSVSVLRRRASERLDDEASPFTQRATRITFRTSRSTSGTSAADIGSAHHRFLERVALERVGSLEDLKSEADRLVREGEMTEEETA